MTPMGAVAHMLCPECHDAVGTMMGGGSWNDVAGSATGSEAVVAREEDESHAVSLACFAFCTCPQDQELSTQGHAARNVKENQTIPAKEKQINPGFFISQDLSF